MGRRGPKSFATKNQLLGWETEWLWFFSGLRSGFPSETVYKWAIPAEPKLQTHPILLDELRKKPMIVKREERTVIGSLPEKKTWFKLLEATTAAEIRQACKASRYWIRLDAGGQNLRIYYFLALLCDPLATILLAAKRANRYPKSARPTSDEKRVRFLARALAGACGGISPRYANEKL